MAVGATAVNRLPFEIWLQIKDLIDPGETTSLYSVNRAWFAIVMNSRYRVLDLTRLHDGVMSRLPLLKDPGIAKRVRHLSISGLALQNSLLSTITGQRVTFPMDRHALSILNRRIRGLDVTTVLNTQVSLMSEVLAGLNLVSEYSVKWDFREGIQSGEVVHASLQAAILNIAWTTFGATLRKIHVSVRPERFHAVLSSDVRLRQLEEFHLELFHTANGTHSLGIQEHISAFFTRVNLRLETLSIQSSSNLDLSCLLHQLPTFKHLRRLFLHIFLDHSVLSDASGLEAFFAHSALKLRHLTLALYHAAVSSAERVLPSLAMARAHIPCLEILEINFGMPHPGLAPTLLHELHALFDGARSTLHTVILEGIALSYADLETATSVFADRDTGDPLRSLTLSVLTLTAAHIDTLAKNVPRISALGIIFTYLSISPDGPPVPESECRTNFTMELRERTYPDWKVRDISIWHHTRNVDSSRWDLVSPFVACIPVTRFFGHPLPQPAQKRLFPRMLDALAQG